MKIVASNVPKKKKGEKYIGRGSKSYEKFESREKCKREKLRKRSIWNFVTLEIKKITADNCCINFKLVENSMEVEFRKWSQIFSNIVFLSSFTFNSTKLKYEEEK